MDTLYITHMYFKYHLHRRSINIFETLKTCNKQISINDAKYELYSVYMYVFLTCIIISIAYILLCTREYQY